MLEKSKHYPILNRAPIKDDRPKAYELKGDEMTGKIARMSDTQTFGFIRKDGVDYFFHRDDYNGHWNDLIRDINNDEDVEVKFTIAESAKGPRAKEVSRMDHPNQVG